MATTTRKQLSQPRRSRDVQGSLATPSPPPPPDATAVTAVTATARGFYGGNRIRIGQSFTLERPEDFSPKWMVRGVPAGSTPPVPRQVEGSSGATGRDRSLEDKDPIGAGTAREGLLDES